MVHSSPIPPSLWSALCDSHYSLVSLEAGGTVQACSILINFINCRATLSNGFQLARRHQVRHATRHAAPIRPRNVKGQREPPQLNCTLKLCVLLSLPQDGARVPQLYMLLFLLCCWDRGNMATWAWVFAVCCSTSLPNALKVTVNMCSACQSDRIINYCNLRACLMLPNVPCSPSSAYRR